MVECTFIFQQLNLQNTECKFNDTFRCFR